MSLNLDARQRAMLQEMGVTVWTRAETTAPLAPAAMQPVTVAVPATAPLPAAPAMAQPPAMPVAQPSSAPAAKAHTAPAPAAPAAHAGLGTPGAAPALRLHAPQLLYPTADPAQTPPGLGAGWLIVTEGIAAADPLGGDAGKLLDNMLRAPMRCTLRLRPVPELVWRTALTRHRLGSVEVNVGDIVVASIVSATQQDLIDDEDDLSALFGGRRDAGSNDSHACPGYRMAMGVMLGVLAGLMEHARVQPTLSPMVLRMTLR